MANVVIKHLRRYEYLISNDVITLSKTKVEITLAFSGSVRVSINPKKKKKKRLAGALEMCKKSIDFQVLSIIGTPKIHATHLYCLAVQAGFYSHMVECWIFVRGSQV